jgi:catechol 2,3-dioxygenase-like lactoylglutathione lyase family enzyme
MGIERLDHYSVRTMDLERTIQFYQDALGLRAGFRPPFRFPGAWMYAAPLAGEAEGKAIVHLIGIDRADSGAVAEYLGDQRGAERMGTGAFDHIAFAASGIAEMRARLGRHGIAFRERRVPNMELHQVFIHDPEGVMIELNYSHPDDLAT